MHVVPWQQPGQVELQLVPMHLPSEQISLAAQATHMTPEIPQVSCSEVLHDPLESQQPVTQSLAQGVVHLFATQVAEPLQISQAAPPIPQAVGLVPGR